MSSDPQAKTDRANENLRALDGLIAVFAANAYSIEMKPDRYGGGLPPIPEVDIWVEATKEPPSLTWGPIIGDIVHGFRSALDQLVWGLSVQCQGPTNPHPRSVCRGVAPGDTSTSRSAVSRPTGRMR
jgi:hypothetical protein